MMKNALYFSFCAINIFKNFDFFCDVEKWFDKNPRLISNFMASPTGNK